MTITVWDSQIYYDTKYFSFPDVDCPGICVFEKLNAQLTLHKQTNAEKQIKEDSQRTGQRGNARLLQQQQQHTKNIETNTNF